MVDVLDLLVKLELLVALVHKEMKEYRVLLACQGAWALMASKALQEKLVRSGLLGFLER